MGTSVWLLNLIKPAPGRVIISADYSQQEPGIGAALSGDLRMQRAYNTGDFYLGFGIETGAVTGDQVQRYFARQKLRKRHDLPLDANDRIVTPVRTLYKPVVLGIIYDRSEWGLARALDLQPIEARKLIEQTHEAFPQCRDWSNRRVNYALAHRCTSTVMGWQLHLRPETIAEDAYGRVIIKGPNVRAVRNFAFQAHGAEITRLGARLAWERGVVVLMTVHDQILAEADEAHAQEVAAVLEACMIEASCRVLGRFALRVESKIIAYPHRYHDPRGEEMWRIVTDLIADIEREQAA
jgi:DNA polymerase I-like protein with 3'-5' exonuclease and polymerase domains